MALAKYVKAAGEVKRYSIDYSNWLDTGEVLTGVLFPVMNNTLTNPLVVSGVAVITGNTSVQFMVSGGTDGTTYKVLATANTVGGQVKEDSILFAVREP